MFIGNPANGDKLQLEYPWATEVSIAHNKPIELKLYIDPNVRFECRIGAKAIIFFISKNLKPMLLTIITPTIGKEITNVLKNPEAKKIGRKINRMIPKIPNFDNKAAGNKLIRVLASQCTSGNR